MATNNILLTPEEVEFIAELIYDEPIGHALTWMPPYKLEKLFAKFNFSDDKCLIENHDDNDAIRKRLIDEKRQGRPMKHPEITVMEKDEVFSTFVERKSQQSFRMSVYQYGKKNGKKFSVNHGVGGHMFVSRIE